MFALLSDRSQQLLRSRCCVVRFVAVVFSCSPFFILLSHRTQPHTTNRFFNTNHVNVKSQKKIRRIERNKNVLWRESNFYTLQMVGSALFKIHFGFIIILYMLSDTNSERDTFPFSCTFSIISRKRAINREKQLQEWNCKGNFRFDIRFAYCMRCMSAICAFGMAILCQIKKNLTWTHKLLEWILHLICVEPMPKSSVSNSFGSRWIFHILCIVAATKVWLKDTRTTRIEMANFPQANRQAYTHTHTVMSRAHALNCGLVERVHPYRPIWKFTTSFPSTCLSACVLYTYITTLRTSSHRECRPILFDTNILYQMHFRFVQMYLLSSSNRSYGGERHR